MKYENEKLGCSFELPDKLTVRQQLAFWQRYADVGEDESTSVRNWEAGKPLIGEWQCEALPDITISLDEMTGTHQARVVTWAGSQVTRFVLSLDELAPNS